MRWIIAGAIAISAAACVHDNLVTCGDELCPAGSLCDTATGTCADSSGLSVPDGPIDLQVSCGASSTTTLPVRNVGHDSVDFELAATLGGVTATPSAATLAPGDEVDVQLVATALSESIPGIAALGDLLVAVNGGQPLARPLQLTTNGAVVSTLEQTLDFGESSVPASPLVRAFSVVNTGNEDAAVDPVAPAAPYSLFGPSAGSVDLAAGSTQMISVAFQPLDGSFDSTLALAFTGNQCQPPPTSVALSGVGTGDPILVDHLVLDFGSGACGASAESLPLTFTNNDPAAQPLTFGLIGNTGFTFGVDPAPTLAAGPSMATVMVTRNPLSPPHSPGLVTATLEIMAPALGTPTLVTLDQMISAPQLTLSTQQLVYNNLPEFGGAQTAIQIMNTGNAIANVTVSPASMTYPGGTEVLFTPSSFQVPAGGGVMGTVTVGAGSAPISTTTLIFELTADGSCNGSQSLSVTFSVSPPA